MGLLHDAGLAQFYAQDVAALNPLLDAMSQRGMPIDQATRLQAAQALAKEREAIVVELQQVMPPECCPTKTYKKQPKGTQDNVISTQIAVMGTYCTYCSARRPTKKHTCFKDKPLGTEQRAESVTVWVKRLPFVVSSKGLLGYFKHKGYPIPKKYDRATGVRRDTTDEAAVLRLALTKETDPVLPLVLRFRDVDKQLSTYVGRPV